MLQRYRAPSSSSGSGGDTSDSGPPLKKGKQTPDLRNLSWNQMQSLEVDANCAPS